MEDGNNIEPLCFTKVRVSNGARIETTLVYYPETNTIMEEIVLSSDKRWFPKEPYDQPHH